MISIEQAQQLISEQQVSLTSIELPLDQSLGFYLADDVIAPFDLPSFDNSAMDGYAVCGSGQSFEIIGEVAAGSTTLHRLAEGQAMRIFTGGKVPQNTTSVMMQEKTEVSDTYLRLLEPVLAGKNIRKKGEELAKGGKVFEKGHYISPATIGLLSSLGMSSVQVFQKPKVSIIVTGNELINSGTPLQEGQIYESNSQSLSSALEQYDFQTWDQVQISDDLDKIAAGIAAQLSNCDVLLLSGGISVGEYDFVKEALERNGVQEVFYKVLQKPGKPLYFGRKGQQFVFALPGNPASSLTCFYVYVLPLLQKMSGGIGEGLLRFNVPLNHDFDFNSDRPTFLKAQLKNQEVSILEGQGSSMIHSMAGSNTLVFIQASNSLKKGDLVSCILL